MTSRRGKLCGIFAPAAVYVSNHSSKAFLTMGDNSTQELISVFSTASESGWTLQSSAQLQLWLEGFTSRISARADDIAGKVQNLADHTSTVEQNLKNTFNSFRLLSNTQFIENRVYEEDETATISGHQNVKGQKHFDTYDDDIIPRYKEAVHVAWDAYQSVRKDISVPVGSLKRSQELKLPSIVGSEDFLHDPYCGLRDIVRSDAAGRMNYDTNVEKDGANLAAEMVGSGTGVLSEGDWSGTESEVSEDQKGPLEPAVSAALDFKAMLEAALRGSYSPYDTVAASKESHPYAKYETIESIVTSSSGVCSTSGAVLDEVLEKPDVPDILAFSKNESQGTQSPSKVLVRPISRKVSQGRTQVFDRPRIQTVASDNNDDQLMQTHGTADSLESRFNNVLGKSIAKEPVQNVENEKRINKPPFTMSTDLKSISVSQIGNDEIIKAEVSIESEEDLTSIIQRLAEDGRMKNTDVSTSKAVSESNDEISEHSILGTNASYILPSLHARSLLGNHIPHEESDDDSSSFSGDCSSQYVASVSQTSIKTVKVKSSSFAGDAIMQGLEPVNGSTQLLINPEVPLPPEQDRRKDFLDGPHMGPSAEEFRQGHLMPKLNLSGLLESPRDDRSEMDASPMAQSVSSKLPSSQSANELPGSLPLETGTSNTRSRLRSLFEDDDDEEDIFGGPSQTFSGEMLQVKDVEALDGTVEKDKDVIETKKPYIPAFTSLLFGSDDENDDEDALFGPPNGRNMSHI